MAGITDKFNGSKTELRYGTSVADVTTINKVAADALTAVAKVMDLGTISNEANVIDVPEFGQDYAGKLVGQLNAGTLDMTIAWNPGDTSHIALKDAVTNKTKTLFAIRWTPDGTANDYVTFNAYVASFGIETSIDDAVKATVSLAIDGQLHFFDA